MKSPLVRKLRQIPKRVWADLRSGEGSAPAVFVNSYPKSGTHLLSQVFDKCGLVNDYGRFITQASSIRFQLKRQEQTQKEFRKIRRGELVKGHIFYDDTLVARAAGRQIPIFYIYRDLRACLVSELHYLGSMNRYHRLHGNFVGLSDRDRAELVIVGLPNGGRSGLYRDIGERYRPFLGWNSDPNVLPIRYETLVEDPVSQLTVIWSHYKNVTGVNIDIDSMVSISKAAISPERSHTFRAGRVDGWKEVLDDDLLELFERCAGQLNRDLGYAK